MGSALSHLCGKRTSASERERALEAIVLPLEKEYPFRSLGMEEWGPSLLIQRKTAKSRIQRAFTHALNHGSRELAASSDSPSHG